MILIMHDHKSTMIHRLGISFGKDQESAIDEVLKKLADDIEDFFKSDDKEKNIVNYMIIFKTVYGAYSFGWYSGKISPWR